MTAPGGAQAFRGLGPSCRKNGTRLACGSRDHNDYFKPCPPSWRDPPQLSSKHWPVALVLMARSLLNVLLVDDCSRGHGLPDGERLTTLYQCSAGRYATRRDRRHFANRISPGSALFGSRHPLPSLGSRAGLAISTLNCRLFALPVHERPQLSGNTRNACCPGLTARACFPLLWLRPRLRTPPAAISVYWISLSYNFGKLGGWHHFCRRPGVLPAAGAADLDWPARQLALACGLAWRHSIKCPGTAPFDRQRPQLDIAYTDAGGPNNWSADVATGAVAGVPAASELTDRDRYSYHTCRVDRTTTSTTQQLAPPIPRADWLHRNGIASSEGYPACNLTVHLGLRQVASFWRTDYQRLAEPGAEDGRVIRPSGTFSGPLILRRTDCSTAQTDGICRLGIG